MLIYKVEDLDEIKNIPVDISKRAEVKEEKSSKAVEQKDHISGTSLRRISPVARLLIREYGLDVSSLKPSGPRGTLLKSDVLEAIKSGKGSKQASRPSQEKTSTSAHSVQSTTHTTSQSAPASPVMDDYEDFPNSQIRKVRLL